MAKLMHASVPSVARTDLGREQSLENLEELSHGGKPGVRQTMWFNLHGDRSQGRFGSAPKISTPKSIQNHSYHQQPPTKGHLSPTGRQSLEER